MRAALLLLFITIPTIHSDLIANHFDGRVHRQLNSFLQDNHVEERMKEQVEQKAQELSDILNAKKGSGASLEDLENVILNNDHEVFYPNPRSKRLVEEEEDMEFYDLMQPTLEEMAREVYGEDDDVLNEL